ncbi:S-adenosyl-L-methionine-dependent methyltransferase [Sporodiniella umbellata]|nr:S-adenosyl-L-methionine-dependent methyltransferase [Sporodiniella umbellata]
MNFLNEPINSGDDIVRGTNDDATTSRLSAAALQYLQDPFVHCFVKKPVRRSPIINRGTFIRNYALDRLVQQFLSLGPKKQIVSLGAGFDTRYFTIKAGLLDTETAKLSPQLARYFEIDFSEITTKKAMTIHRQRDLSELIGEMKIERGGLDLKAKDYCLLGGDLRNWSEVSNHLLSAGFDVNVPTLFLSECVFIYLSPHDSQKIIQWITETTSHAMFALYEQIKPNDAFGKMMIRNLKSRSIDLKGIYEFPDLIHQQKRFKDLGWNHAVAMDINTVHDQCVSKEEIARIAKIEMLDELEEWRMISAHYCIVWAYKTKEFLDLFSKVNLKN